MERTESKRVAIVHFNNFDRVHLEATIGLLLVVSESCSLSPPSNNPDGFLL